MKNTEKQSEMNNLKLAQAFEVEGLEERVEFRKWNEHASFEAEVGATCGDGGCDGYVKDATLTTTIYF